MALLGEDFNPNVRAQIEKRQELYAAGNKSDKNIQLQNTNSWLRLASSVDIKVDRKQTPESKYAEYAARVQEYTSRYEVGEGQLLAEQLILTGGTAYRTEDGQGNSIYASRYGISEINSMTPLGAYGLGGPDFGYRPMPGIESADVTYYNNGALAKADVKIKCFSARQLDLLETLYLRPGYTVLLEWGHNTYTDNNGNIITPDSLTEPFTKFLPPFGTTTLPDRDELQAFIQAEREKRFYNYDAFYGVITNFSWTLSGKDQTYDVTLKLVTTGAIIESLRIDSGYNAISGSDSLTRTIFKTDLSVWAGFREAFGNTVPTYTTESAPAFLEQLLYTRSQESTLMSSMYNVVTALDTSRGVDRYGKYGGDEPELTVAVLPDLLQLANLKNDPTQVNYSPGPGSVFSWSVDQRDTGNPTANVDSLYYITFDNLMAVLQSECLLYEKDGKPVVRLDFGIDKAIPMFTIPGRMSADPAVCLINITEMVDTVKTKITPDLTNSDINTLSVVMSKPTNPVLNEVGYLNFRSYSNYLSGGGFVTPPSAVLAPGEQFVGFLNNVAVNVEHVLAVMDKNNDEDARVSLISFLQDLLADINIALGDINQFKVKFNEETKVVSIYDEAVFFRKRTNPITVLRSTGVSVNTDASIIKELGITTQLSNEMASMVAIGAQVNANTLGENATAFSQFNIGLVDRITPVKYEQPPKSFIAKKSPEQKWLDLTTTLNTLINQIYPNTLTPKAEQGNSADGNKPSFTVLREPIKQAVRLNQKYANFLVGYYTSVTEEIPPPFIIPFKMNVTIPGISGATIYQRFGMDTTLLPFSYKNKIDYLIVNLTHKISTNSWNTTWEALTVPKIK
jgi:hypothetical protein